MTLNTAQHCSGESRYRACAMVVSFLCAALFATLLMSGCSVKKRPAGYWRTAGVVHPAMPATVAPHPKPLPDESADPIPELQLEIPPPPPLLAVHAVPARPHVPPATNPDNGGQNKPEIPAMVPQLSAEQSSAEQQQMAASLAIAEKNLGRARGRHLNANQTDLAGKIKGFMADARAAGREGDWTRARSLATKAQVLSEELAASL
jgi:hypothetical protein